MQHNDPTIENARFSSGLCMCLSFCHLSVNLSMSSVSDASSVQLDHHNHTCYHLSPGGKKETARNDTYGTLVGALSRVACVVEKSGCRSWQGRQGKFADLEHEGFGQVI